MVVIDTNVLVYLLIEGDRTRAARDLFAKDSDWLSETFILVEFSNVLSTYVRLRSLTKARAQSLLAHSVSLLTDRRHVSHELALETAIEFGISAYDARFIACAQQMGARLVTEDGRLRTAVPSWTMSLTEAV